MDGENEVSLSILSAITKEIRQKKTTLVASNTQSMLATIDSNNRILRKEKIDEDILLCTTVDWTIIGRRSLYENGQRYHQRSLFPNQRQLQERQAPPRWKNARSSLAEVLVCRFSRGKMNSKPRNTCRKTLAIAKGLMIGQVHEYQLKFQKKPKLRDTIFLRGQVLFAFAKESIQNAMTSSRHWLCPKANWPQEQMIPGEIHFFWKPTKSLGASIRVAPISSFDF